MYPQVLPPLVVDNVLLIMQRIFSAPLIWFERLMYASGFKPFWLTCIFILLVGRFILVPLFGSSLGSDKAKKKDTDNG